MAPVEEVSNSPVPDLTPSVGKTDSTSGRGKKTVTGEEGKSEFARPVSPKSHSKSGRKSSAPAKRGTRKSTPPEIGNEPECMKESPAGSEPAARNSRAGRASAAGRSKTSKSGGAASDLSEVSDAESTKSGSSSSGGSKRTKRRNAEKDGGGTPAKVRRPSSEDEEEDEVEVADMSTSIDESLMSSSAKNKKPVKKTDTKVGTINGIRVQDGNMCKGMMLP